ncbi:hypothetical protein QQ045_031317 [Rhodiola kirilowii]
MEKAVVEMWPNLPGLAANGGDDVLSPKYALVVLNQSIPRFTPLLWQHAEIRLCADGGANKGTQVFDESQDQDTTDLHKCINYICAITPDEHGLFNV